MEKANTKKKIREWTLYKKSSHNITLLKYVKTYARKKEMWIKIFIELHNLLTFHLVENW